MKNKKILVQNADIAIKQVDKIDFISLTDTARYKDTKRSDYWIRGGFTQFVLRSPQKVA